MKNLSFSILLFIVAFLLSGENQAQTDFRKGYIITTERDTIQGLIDYQSEIKNCKICVFKNDMDTQPLSLSPEDILAYRYNNEKLYVRKEINNDSITKLVFIEFIVNGIIDLFFYADISGSFYFIEEGNGTLNYLKIENKIASNLNNKNKNYYFNFKEYIGILKIVFKDNPELYPLIEHTKLNHQSLVKLLNKYHNINRSKENYELYVKKIQIVKIGLSLFTSLNSNKINVYEGKFDVPYEKEYYPTFGITADVMFPKFSNNFSLQLSGDIGKTNYYHSYKEDYYYSNMKEKKVVQSLYEFNINSNQLIFSGGIKYIFPIKQLKPFIVVGIANSYLNDLKTERTMTTFNSGKQKINEYNDIEITDFLSGFYFSAGLYYYNKKSRRIAELMVEYKNLKGEGYGTIIEMNIFSMGLGIYLF